MKQYCLWITGKPNAGKSTLTYHLLQGKLRNCVVIDGDRFRETVNSELRFTKEDILKNNRTAIKVVKYLMSLGFNVLVAMVTPYEEARQEARKEIANYMEIYLSCPTYARKQRPNFRDMNCEYEIPKQEDVLLDTHLMSINKCVDAILLEMEKKEWI